MSKTATVTAWIRQGDLEPAEDMATALRHIANQLEQGMTSGYYPTWELKVEEEE